MLRDVILAEEGAPPGLVTLDVADHPVSARVPEHERARLLEALEHRSLRPGETLVRAGDASDALYLVTSGRLTVRRSDGSRAVTLSAGMVVGELGAAGRSRRSADVVAETAVECHALRWEELLRLGERRPAVHAAVLEVLLEELARIVQRLERELSSVAPRVPASRG